MLTGNKVPVGEEDAAPVDIRDYGAGQENKGLLRFLTCGSVDDGKSTLIGRLLYDTKLIFEDQLAALERNAPSFGIDYIDAVAPETVVAQRIVWSVLFVGLFLMLMRRTREIGEIAREPRLVGLLCISAGLIAVNWLVFVWAVEHEKVLDVSLGYFINPLVSILVGLVVLREKLSPLQGVAVGLAAAGVALQAVLLGGLPWVSLLLAFSFAGYGYVRKITPVRPTPGLWMETVLLLETL